MNPLDYDARRRMIEEAFGEKFQIFYIKDERSDAAWSKKLDDIIQTVAGKRDAMLFGTNEALSRYSGRFLKEVYESPKSINMENQMKDLAGKKVLSGEAWRAGAIWATQNRYDHACPTVDCLIYDGPEVWMGKKSTEEKLRFVGGFVDPGRDSSFEEAALREAKEETGLECTVVEYIRSWKVDDWRYVNETDKVFTSLFALNRVGGTPAAGDDIAEIRRVNLMSLSEDDVVEEHIPLLNAAKEWHREMMQETIEKED
jgi:bifunctional NMN adenylyltransferase/nudix hydrolase